MNILLPLGCCIKEENILCYIIHNIRQFKIITDMLLYNLNRMNNSYHQELFSLYCNITRYSQIFETWLPLLCHVICYIGMLDCLIKIYK